MKRPFLLLLMSVLFVLSLAGCNSRLSSQEQINETDTEKSIYFVYDSENPILMQPDINTVLNIFNSNHVEVDMIDLDGKEYSSLQNLLDTTSHTGMVLCLPYDLEADYILHQIHGADFIIIQFGGDYYPNDISVSIDYKYVGYLVGKKIGEIFIERNKVSPRLGFYSTEREWKIIEQGFIEGLSEIVPEAYIVSRRIVTMDGETVMVSGSDDVSKLDGVCTFFCESGSKNIEYMDNIIQAKVGIEAGQTLAGNVIMSLIIEDNHITDEALTQFAQLLQGNKTTRNKFSYDAVFEKA